VLNLQTSSAAKMPSLRSLPPLFLIAPAAILLYSCFLGTTPFHSRGESREALVVRAMVESNDFILPRSNIGEIAHKPPLYHWAAVAAVKATGGLSEYAIRLPSILFAATGLVMLWYFVAVRPGSEVASLATALLASPLVWMQNAGHARVDMALTVCLQGTLISLFFVLERWREKRSTAWGWVCLAGIGGLLSMLSKGPMGLLLPVAIAGLYALVLLRKPYLDTIRRLPLLPLVGALLVALCVGGLWYLKAYASGGDEFFKVHVVNENLGRFIDVPDFKPGHIKPPYYSVVYLAVGWFPWTLLLPLVGTALWQARRELMKPEYSPILFCVCWVLVVFLLVTLSSAKRSVYLMPAYPALAYLSAWAVGQRTDSDLGRSARVGFTLFAILFGILLLLLAIVAATSVETLEAWDQRWGLDLEQNAAAITAFRKGRLVLFPLLLAGCGVVAATMMFWRRKAAPMALGILSLVMVTSGASVGAYVLRHLGQMQSAERFMVEVQKEVPDGAVLFMVNSQYYPPGYYAARPCRISADSETMIETPGSYALSSEKHYLRMTDAFRETFEVIRKSHPYAADGRRALWLLRHREAETE